MKLPPNKRYFLFRLIHFSLHSILISDLLNSLNHSFSLLAPGSALYPVFLFPFYQYITSEPSWKCLCLGCSNGLAPYSYNNNSGRSKAVLPYNSCTHKWDHMGTFGFGDVTTAVALQRGQTVPSSYLMQFPISLPGPEPSMNLLLRKTEVL